MKQIKRIAVLLFLLLFSESTIVLGSVRTTGSAGTKQKKWNFIVYIAANNNLYRFALPNIIEMKKVGSNDKVNIFIQIDNFGKKEVSRYKIEKDKLVKIAGFKTPPISLSGTPENLFHFVESVVTENPADHQALILWNHGSGIKDPYIWRESSSYHPDEYIGFNPETNSFEARSPRGIAFNDVGQTYLTNDSLKITLNKIKDELLDGKKIDVLGMDACHMSMIEIGTQVKDSAKYMVSSQEAGPGYGWNYTTILEPFLEKSPTPLELASHIVDCYEGRYRYLISDFTHSAIKLDDYNLLEKNLDTTATLLLELIKDSGKTGFFQNLKKIRKSHSATTSFRDPDYIDLTHLYKSLLDEAKNFSAKEDQKELVDFIKKNLEEGLGLLSNFIVRNVCGPGVANAHGLSIYFPTKRIHASYVKTDFAKNTKWCEFLFEFLKARIKELQV